MAGASGNPALPTPGGGVPVFECVPNFSVGTVGGGPGADIVRAGGDSVLDADADVEHGRAVVSLAGTAAVLVEAAYATVASAVTGLDLREATGVHPRVGVADVVPLVPLGGGASLAAAREAAERLAWRTWEEARVPVYLYGAASSASRGRLLTLADIRAGGERAGPPDVGGPAPHPTAGYCCVGARGELVAYNIRLNSVSWQQGRELASSIRASSPGGLTGVMALAFTVAGVTQLSMNLVDIDATPPAAVLAEVGRRLRERGLPEPGEEDQELVGLCPARGGAGCGAAGGRVLEGRMVAAVARRAAAQARQAGGPAGAGAGPLPGAGGGSGELAALAINLAATAARLADLRPDPLALLGAAEQAAALPRVLAAARLNDPDGDALCHVAAVRLLAASDAVHDSRLGARVAALKRWLRLDGPA